MTKKRTPLTAVLVVHNKKMKDPWCVATNRCDMSASQVVKAYGRRFSIEETFRDAKNGRFGLGMSDSRVSKSERRDRLFFLAAIAGVLRTPLAAAGEEIGIDCSLKVNTSKKRQYSLHRQGTEWYALIPTMDGRQLRRLRKKVGELIQDHAMCRRVVGVI